MPNWRRWLTFHELGRRKITVNIESNDQSRQENMSFCYTQSKFIALNTIKITHFFQHSNKPQNDWPVTGNVNGTKQFSEQNERRIKQFIHKLWLSLCMLITHSTNSSIFYPLHVKTFRYADYNSRWLCAVSVRLFDASLLTHESSNTLLICFSLLYFHSLLFCF